MPIIGRLVREKNISLFVEFGHWFSSVDHFSVHLLHPAASEDRKQWRRGLTASAQMSLLASTGHHTQKSNQGLFANCDNSSQT